MALGSYLVRMDEKNEKYKNVYTGLHLLYMNGG